MKRKKYILLFLFVAIITAIIGYHLVIGLTPRRVARIIVEDRKFGFRSLEKAHKLGDNVLPYIRDESDNFDKLDNRNSFWIAEIISNNSSVQSISIANNLYSRDNPLQKMVGVIGLMAHNKYPEPLDDNAFVVKAIRGEIISSNGAKDLFVQLAAIALGKNKSIAGSKYLIDALNTEQHSYWNYAYICEALMYINDRSTIPYIRNAFKKKDFHALSEGFNALVCIGDRQAIPLAITRINPSIKGFNEEMIIEDLEKLTKQNYTVPL